MGQCIRRLFYTDKDIYPSMEKLLALVISKAKENTNDYEDLSNYLISQKYRHLTKLERDGYVRYINVDSALIYKTFVADNEIIAVNKSEFGELAGRKILSEFHLLLKRNNGSIFAIIFQHAESLKVIEKSSKQGLGKTDSILAGKFFTAFNYIDEFFLVSINPKSKTSRKPLKYINVQRREVNMELVKDAIKNEDNDCFLCRKKQICFFQDSLNLLNGSAIQDKNNVSSTWRMPDLNNAQLSVATIDKGIVRVNAVPGSGKTTTLIDLGRRLIDKGYLGDDLLFMSFTDNGVKELKTRFEMMSRDAFADSPHMLDEATRVTFLSYNGLGNALARKNTDNDFFEAPRIINRVDSLLILQRIIEENPDLDKFPASYENPFSKKPLGVCVYLLDFIDRIKKEMLEHIAMEKEYVLPEMLAFVYEEYEKRKTAACLIDYNDQLLILIRYLAKHKLYYKIVVVDEFQDSNMAHIHILKKMAAYLDALIIVDDDSQAIFSFNNVYPDNMIKFHTHFENVNDLMMTTNYRSCQQIIDASNKIINYSVSRIDKTIIGVRPGGIVDTIQINSKNDIVDFYKANIARNKRTLVLCGNNQDCEKVSSAFTNQLIPVSLEYSILNDLLYALMNLLSAMIVGEKNYVPFALSVLRLKSITDITFEEIDEVYNKLVQIKLHQNSFYELRKYFFQLSLIKANVNPFDILDDGNINKIEKAFTYLRVYLESSIAERKSIISKDDNESYIGSIPIRISTFHNAKGSEYDVVIIDGTSLRKTIKNNIRDEDYRLLYVGFTRAKDELYLMHNENLSQTENALEFFAHAAITGAMNTDSKKAV